MQRVSANLDIPPDGRNSNKTGRLPQTRCSSEIKAEAGVERGDLRLR